MASKSIFISIISLVLLCLLLMREPSECSSAYGCFGANASGFKDIRNRKVSVLASKQTLYMVRRKQGFSLISHKKVLATLREKKTTLKGSHGGSSSSKYGEKSVTWELRKVPSGPDPLHHNGGGPKKPKTP